MVSFCFCCVVSCSGGDRPGKTACKQQSELQPTQSAAAGTSDGTADRKEAIRGLAAKVPQNKHEKPQKFNFMGNAPFSFSQSWMRRSIKPAHLTPRSYDIVKHHFCIILISGSKPTKKLFTFFFNTLLYNSCCYLSCCWEGCWFTCSYVYSMLVHRKPPFLLSSTSHQICEHSKIMQYHR